MSDISRSPGIMQKYDTFGYVYEATFAHSAVHRDVIVQAEHYFTGVSSIDFLIKVPSGTFPHMSFTLTCDASMRVQFYEGSNISADGTPVLTARLNRTTTKSTNNQIFHTPTISSLGTQLPGGYLAGGTGGTAQGAIMAIHNDAEWLLKTNTNYVVRLTAPLARTGSMKFEWYE